MPSIQEKEFLQKKSIISKRKIFFLDLVFQMKKVQNVLVWREK